MTMFREPQAIEPLTAMDALTLTAALGASGHRSPIAGPPITKGLDNRRAKAPVRCKKVKDVVFEISQDANKCYCARCISENLSTYAETWEKLRGNIRQAVKAFSLEQYRTHRIQLHIVRDETWVLR
jgi:hypothetical protein